MTSDVRQWLAEIQSLQRKLTDLQKERDEAYASATNWRSLYEIEAKQRRSENEQARQTIQTLQSSLEVAHRVAAMGDRPLPPVQSQAPLETLLPDDFPEDLKNIVVAALVERDRACQALQAERDAHEKTRRSLTAALGDTVDLLAKERSVRLATSEASFAQQSTGHPIS